jgi:hypothetical protein
MAQFAGITAPNRLKALCRCRFSYDPRVAIFCYTIPVMARMRPA